MEKKVFEFNDLFLDVPNEDKNLETKYARLLDGVSGKFVSGQLTAVMGASGAGKSTLFNMLQGRISNDCKSYGTVLYNGQERNTYDWIHKVAYLKQDDIYYTKFSILEAIMFNLDFYQPFTSKKEKLGLAEDLLRRSNIFEKRNAYIESLSGGERKRAMIALSMCSDPDIIFMDEPTSGLDSHSALILINFMKTYAKENNKIVVISLHQPGEALFNLFENILYLGKGAVFYDGKISDIPKWLEQNKMPKPEGISLAEYLFELHSDNPHPPEIGEYRSIVEQIISSNRKKYDHLRKDDILEKNLSRLYFEKSFSMMSVITFLRRFYLDLHRNEGFFVSMIAYILILAVFLFFAYLLNVKNFTGSLLSVSFNSESFGDLVNHAKSYYTFDMRRYTSLCLFNALSVADILYYYFVKNVCNNRVQILEDIYSAKYSVLTCYLGYFLHDFIVTLFWFGLSAGTAFWSGFMSLTNYWFYIYLGSVVLCFTINYLFMKCLFGFSSRSSLLNNIMSYVGLMMRFKDVGDLPLIVLRLILPASFKKRKYILALLFIFPQLALNAIFKYKNIESINNHLGDVKGNQIYVPSFSVTEMKATKSESAFASMGLEECSFGFVMSLFVASLIINLIESLFFFNRHVNAELRLKLKR